MAQKAKILLQGFMAIRPDKENGVSSQSFQLSEPSCVSMSTLQMGHFLLVASHWSTHTWWKRCMQGSLLWREKHHPLGTSWVEGVQGTEGIQKGANGAAFIMGKHHCGGTGTPAYPGAVGQRWCPWPKPLRRSHILLS